MPISLAEAMQRLAANPLSPDAETRTALVAHHGEDGYKKLRYETTRNTAGSIRVTATPTAAPAPIPAPPTGPSSPENDWEATVKGAEAELVSNPVFMSSAARALLKQRYGAAEFNRRLRHAIETSGQRDLKVTAK
jgi:hypothetical protein